MYICMSIYIYMYEIGYIHIYTFYTYISSRRACLAKALLGGHEVAQPLHSFLPSGSHEINKVSGVPGHPPHHNIFKSIHVYMYIYIYMNIIMQVTIKTMIAIVIVVVAAVVVVVVVVVAVPPHL